MRTDESRAESIGVIGVYPPPSGGQGMYTLHVCEELRRRGWPTQAIDVSGTWSPLTSLVQAPSRISLIRELCRASYAGFLLTASDSRPLGFEFLTALVCTVRNVPFFYNILAGRFADRFASYDAGHRLILRFALKRARILFVSNGNQAMHLIRLTHRPPYEIRVIGCRIPVGADVVDDPEIIGYIRSGRPGIVGVGAMRETYGFQLLIRACAHLAGAGYTPSILLVVSGDEDPVVVERIHEEAQSARGAVEVRICRELPRPVVLGAIRAANLMVRPTRFDGDSLTIHEALQLGTPVVASDAAPRPTGVHIHAVDDVGSLTRSMIEALQSPSARTEELHIPDPVDHIEDALRYCMGTLVS